MTGGLYSDGLKIVVNLCQYIPQDFLKYCLQISVPEIEGVFKNDDENLHAAESLVYQNLSDLWKFQLQTRHYNYILFTDNFLIH